MRRANKGINSIFLALLFITSIVLSIYCNVHLGFYSISESESYIPFFLSSTPILQKLFYYPITDYYYRARELSVVFQIIDTKFLTYFAKIGYPHLLSVIHYLGFICITYFLYRIENLITHNKIPRLSLLFSLILFTTPAFFLSGFYFRPSKILVAIGISALSYLLLQSFYDTKFHKFSLFTYAKIFFATFFLVASDEQGIFYALLFFVILFCVNALVKKIHISSLLGIISGLVMIGIHRYITGPILTKAITGLSPQLWDINDLPLLESFSNFSGVTLLVTYSQYFFGSLPIIILVPMALAFLFALYQVVTIYSKPLYKRILLFFTFWLIPVLSFIIFFQILSLRHPVILWPEYMILYYPIPFFTFSTFSIFILLLLLQQNNAGSKKIILILSFLWIGLNGYAIFSHIQTLLAPTTTTSVYFSIANRYLEPLRHPKEPLQNFPLDHTKAVQAIRDTINSQK